MLLLFVSACLFDVDLYARRKEELTDHDGDSFVQERDCDDANAAIFPDAVEVCDGVDQDCDGEVDEDAADATSWYPDADGDGHGGAVGVVTGCAAPDSSFVVTSDDCDDTNAGAHPGADEVPYDAVDQDCDGADLEDVDGDGWPAEVTGGGDCDDADAGVNPDAAETWADGVTDNDCDGEIEAIQLDYGASSWAGWRSGEGLGRRVAALGDVDGDGLADVAIGSEWDSMLGDASGALYRVDGAPGGSLEGAPGLLPAVGGQSFAAAVDAGRDVTGDGVGDVLVTATGTASTAGGAWLVDGAAWASGGGASVDAVTWGEVRATVAGTYGPGAARFVGDVNGDGVEDVALGECCVDGGNAGSRGRVAIVSSATFAGTLDDADVILDGPWVDAYFGYAVDTLGDQDGDGLPELLVSGAGGLTAAVVSGTTSGNVTDLASTLLYGEVGGTLARNVGDMDGDGRDDVAIVGQANLVALFTAVNATPTRDLANPTFTFTWTEHSGVYDVLPLGDLDEDGRSELLIPEAWSDSGTQRLWILTGDRVTARGTLDAAAVPLTGVSSVPAALFGYAAALAGDVDGDGRGDVVLGAPEYSAGATHAGGATLVTVPE